MPDCGPLIAVTGPDGWLPVAWWCIRRALRRHGARPVRLTPRRPQPPAPPDAVVISGGDDIDPGLYLADDGVAPRDLPRDRFEIAVIRQALDRGIPLLGICRGMQLLNVVRGGSLHRDIRPLRRHTPNRRTPLPVKDVAIAPGSRLAQAMGVATVRVNSLHHQAVDRLGDGLHVVARDADGFVQGVEGEGPQWLVGVQWHPEYLPQRPEQRALFAALCRTAGG